MDKNGEDRLLGALQRIVSLQKSEITMEVGGWVQVSLGIFFGKSSQNSPKAIKKDNSFRSQQNSKLTLWRGIFFLTRQNLMIA